VAPTYTTFYYVAFEKPNYQQLLEVTHCRAMMILNSAAEMQSKGLIDIHCGMHRHNESSEFRVKVASYYEFRRLETASFSLETANIYKQN
jgi:hypothetical protein